VDPYEELRAELEAALQIVETESRGQKDFAATSISPELLAATVEPIAERDQRAELINNVLREMDLVDDAMTALEADGYPTPVPKAELPPDLYAETQGQAADLEAGILVFIPAGSPATQLSITLGPPVPNQE
jgi:hypothetical protein